VTDSDKHSSLLRYGVNYDRKKFYSEGLWERLGVKIREFAEYEKDFIFLIE